ncbi:MAG: hypothetical protein NTX79_03850 [Candidatus Micrarchaeota archaeon]|nr:hypothetical protein [Candidatus Micrarchaeota archaeon]
MWIFQNWADPAKSGAMIGAAKDKPGQKALEQKQKAETNLKKEIADVTQRLVDMTALGTDKNVHPAYVGIYRVFASTIREKILPSLKNAKPTKELLENLYGIVIPIQDAGGFPGPKNELRWAIDNKQESFRQFLDEKIMRAFYHVGQLMPPEEKKPERAKFK